MVRGPAEEVVEGIEKAKDLSDSSISIRTVAVRGTGWILKEMPLLKRPLPPVIGNALPRFKMSCG